jgi:hypothetical protein
LTFLNQPQNGGGGTIFQHNTIRSDLMLTLKYSHENYQSFVHAMLTKFYIDTNQSITLFTNFDYIRNFWSADITDIVKFLKPLYSNSSQGAPPKDAVAMFRSLLLMSFNHKTSIPEWVTTLRADPFFAIISGFIPACLSSSRIVGIDADPIPGVGTFYDFMDRLIRQDKILHKSKLRKRRRKPKSKQKKNRKMDSPPTTLTERLVKRVLKHNGSKLPDSIESTLNDILKQIFVLPSLDMGLLGDPNKFDFAGDGTCMPTHASHFGKKVCNCKLKPGEQCDCKRYFKDPSASWGWDSFKELYFYGHSIHTFTAARSFYSLPIHIKCVTGERHDSVTGIFALKELIDLYPEINFRYGIFDSGYDNISFYRQNSFYNAIPIIALNGRNSKPSSNLDLLNFNDEGIPLGKACGHKLRNWGLIKKSARRKWLFPVQCDNCSKCTAHSNKTFYTPTADNPRYFGPVVRGSKKFKSIYKRRTTTERWNDRLCNDFNAENAVVFSRERRIVRCFIAAFCCYIDAWAAEKAISITDIFPGIVKPAA